MITPSFLSIMGPVAICSFGMAFVIPDITTAGLTPHPKLAGSASALEYVSFGASDTYDYDAFGTLIDRTGSTDNSFLYCGERWDANLGFYYLRARYMNPGTGRFWTMDEFEGDPWAPSSLHKYAYCVNNPVNLSDPSGRDGLLLELLSSFTIRAMMARMVVGAIIGAVDASIGEYSLRTEDRTR